MKLSRGKIYKFRKQTHQSKKKGRHHPKRKHVGKMKKTARKHKVHNLHNATLKKYKYKGGAANTSTDKDIIGLVQKIQLSITNATKGTFGTDIKLLKTELSNLLDTTGQQGTPFLDNFQEQIRKVFSNLSNKTPSKIIGNSRTVVNDGMNTLMNAYAKKVSNQTEVTATLSAFKEVINKYIEYATKQLDGFNDTVNSGTPVNDATKQNVTMNIEQANKYLNQITPINNKLMTNPKFKPNATTYADDIATMKTNISKVTNMLEVKSKAVKDVADAKTKADKDAVDAKTKADKDAADAKTKADKDAADAKIKADKDAADKIKKDTITTLNNSVTAIQKEVTNAQSARMKPHGAHMDAFKAIVPSLLGNFNTNLSSIYKIADVDEKIITETQQKINTSMTTLLKGIVGDGKEHKQDTISTYITLIGKYITDAEKNKNNTKMLKYLTEQAGKYIKEFPEGVLDALKNGSDKGKQNDAITSEKTLNEYRNKLGTFNEQLLTSGKKATTSDASAVPVPNAVPEPNAVPVPDANAVPQGAFNNTPSPSTQTNTENGIDSANNNDNTAKTTVDNPNKTTEDNPNKTTVGNTTKTTDDKPNKPEPKEKQCTPQDLNEKDRMIYDTGLRSLSQIAKALEIANKTGGSKTKHNRRHKSKHNSRKRG